MGLFRTTARSIERNWYAAQVSVLQESLRHSKFKVSEVLPKGEPNRFDRSVSTLMTDGTLSTEKINSEISDDKLDKLGNLYIGKEKTAIEELNSLLMQATTKSAPAVINNAKQAVTNAERVLAEITAIKKLHDFFQTERAIMSCLDPVANISDLAALHGEDLAFVKAYRVKVFNAMHAAQLLDFHGVIQDHKTSPEKVVDVLAKKLNSSLFHDYLTLLDDIKRDNNKLKEMNINITPEQQEAIEKLDNVNNKYVSEYQHELKSKLPNFIKELKRFFDNFEGTNSKGIITIRKTINQYIDSANPLKAFREISKVMHEQGEALSQIKRSRHPFFGMKGRADGVQTVYDYLSKNGINSIEDLTELKGKIQGQVLVHGKKPYVNESSSAPNARP